MIYESVAELAERARGHQGCAADLAAVLGQVGYGPYYTVRKGTRCRVRVTHADGTHTVPGLSDLARRLRDDVEPRPAGAFVSPHWCRWGFVWRTGLVPGCSIRHTETGEKHRVVALFRYDRKSLDFNPAVP